MELALAEAGQAAARGEAPVGAVAVAADGTFLARAHNACIALNDPTAHAEILALRQAGQTLRNYRLCGAVLVVTLEPCLMCLGAMIHARLGGLVFGARDPKAGAVVSRLKGPELDFLNHRLLWMGGISAEPCSALLSSFFRERRREQKAGRCDSEE